MSIELIKKPINVYQAIDEQQREELMETGIIVPDSKPDVMEVLAVDTDCVVKTREKTGKVMEIGGELIYQVIYRADNQEQGIESINVNAPWSLSCNYPAKEEDVYTLVRSNAEHTDLEIVNGRKLSARTVMTLNVKYLIAKTIEAGENVQGENIYQRAQQQDIALLEEMGEKNINLSELLELPDGRPAIEEIMHCNASIKNPSIEDDRMECILGLDILYRPDNDNLQVENANFEIPVSRNLDIERFYTDISYNICIKSINCKPDEDFDGLLTRIRLEGEICIEFVLYSKENVNLVNDAYALDYDFELEKKPMVVGVEERDINENIVIDANLPLDCGDDTLEEVVNVSVKPRLLSAQKNGSAIDVNGCLDIFVLYGTGAEMRILRGTNQVVQFTHRMSLEMDADYDIDVQLILGSNSSDIVSNTELGIKVEVMVKVHISRKAEINIVTGIKGIRTIEKKDKEPILIYYTEAGDTLWDIARKYRVSISKIMNDNGMTEEIEPVAGQKVFLIG